MKGNILTRAVTIGEYIVNTKATVRQTAKVFGISKSTVYTDVSYRLPQYNSKLAQAAAEVLNLNKEERSERGGEATKLKYKKNAA